MGRLVIDGEHVYELDEECIRDKRKKEEQEKKAQSREKKENAGK